MSLVEMIREQLNLQRASLGADPSSLTGESYLDFIRRNVLSLEGELHQTLAIAETGGDHNNFSAVVDAAVDAAYIASLAEVLRYFLNLLLVAGGGRSPGGLAHDLQRQFRSGLAVSSTLLQESDAPAVVPDGIEQPYSQNGDGRTDPMSMEERKERLTRAIYPCGHVIVDPRCSHPACLERMV